MPDIPPPGPLPPGIPNPFDPQEIEKLLPPLPPPPETNEYLGYTFTSQKDYIEFKTKFLVQMANEMIRQVKHNSDQMVQALKKMREDQ